MDKMMNMLVHLALCPGDYQKSCAVCQDCPARTSQACRKDLKKRALNLYQNTNASTQQPCNLRIRISQALGEIGVPASLKGYPFLQHAIELSVYNPKYLDCMTSMLYPEVAKNFDTTPSRVERAMRHAVEVAWERGDLDILQRWFGNSVSYVKGKPTNSEFIARVSDTLRLEMQKEDD